MASFPRVTQSDIERLAAIVGGGNLVERGPELEPYSRDYTEDLAYPPEVVVLPTTAEQVQQIMSLAYERGLPVTPRGAGTGLSGGALPVFGGILLSVERMNRIVEIDEANLMCRVQPGVINQVLKDAVAEQGLYYPPDPASMGSCMIGGNIAENAGGPHCVKYGLTNDYVVSLQAVLPDGRLFQTGGKMRKDVAGYNLTQLLVGSEGTLAIVTEATLRLIPQPRHRRTMLAAFDDLDTAAEAIVKIYQSRITPSVLEILERAALEAAQAHLGRPVPYVESAAHILIEVDGHHESQVEADFLRIGEVLMEAGAIDAMLADTPTKVEELWRVRRCLGEACKAHRAFTECDTAVPPSEVPALMRGVREIAERMDVGQVAFGHAGDGNIHVHLFSDDTSPTVREDKLLPASRAVYEHAASLGGTITGEHGVGCAHMEHLALCRDAVSLSVMRAIKQAIDPKGILNPGKIFEQTRPAPALAGQS